MKLKINFEFAFSMDFRKHSMIIDTDDPAHSKLLEEMDANETDVENIAEALSYYLQYDLIMPKTKILNIVRTTDRLDYDLELDLDGTIFTNHEYIEYHKGMTSFNEFKESDLEMYLIDEFEATHHNFDIYLNEDNITILS